MPIVGEIVLKRDMFSGEDGSSVGVAGIRMSNIGVDASRPSATKRQISDRSEFAGAAYDEHGVQTRVEDMHGPLSDIDVARYTNDKQG